MLNLFIAVILEGFSDSSEDDIVLSPEQLSCFQEAWAELDPDATCFAPVDKMSRFLNNMFDAFGLSQGMTRAQVDHEIIQMQLPIYEKKYVHFKDCMQNMAKAAMLYSAKKRGEDVKNIQFDHPSVQVPIITSKRTDPKMNLERYLAAQALQRAFHKYQKRISARNLSNI